MTCRKVRRLLSSYLDEETTGRARLMVGAHLTRCSECRRIFSQMRGMRLTLLATPRLAVAEDFSRGWRARLREEKEAPSFNRRRSLLLAPALAGLALLFVFFVLIHPRPVPPALKLGSLKRLPALETIPASPPPSPGSGGEAEPSPSFGLPSGGAGRTAVPPQKKAIPPKAAGPLAGKGGDLAPAALQPPQGEGNAEKSLGAAADLPAEEAADGSWRVWLLALGPRPAEVRRILAEEGLLGPGKEAMALEVPLLLRQGLSRGEAQELAGRLERAGGRLRLEFVPR